MRKSWLYILIIMYTRIEAQFTPVDTLPASAGVSIFVDAVWYKKVPAREVGRVLSVYPGLLHCDSIVRVGEGYSAYYSSRDGRVDSLSVVSQPAFPPNLSRRWMRILRHRGLGPLPVPLAGFTIYGRRSFNINGRRVLVVKAANPHHTSAGFVLAPARADGRWAIQGKAHLVLHNGFNRAETVGWDYVADASNKFFRYAHRFPYMFGSAWSNRFELYWNKTADRLAIHATTVFSYETGRWHWGVGGAWMRNADTLQGRIRRYAVLSMNYGAVADAWNFSVGSEVGIGTGVYYIKPEIHWQHWKNTPLTHEMKGFYSTDSIWALTRTTDSYLKFLVPQPYYTQGHLLLYEQFYFNQKGASLYAWHRIYALFGRFFVAESLFLSGLGLENGTESGRLRIEIGYPYAKSFHIDNEQFMFSIGYVFDW